MALGLLLQVSCICFILFDCSTALPVLRRYGSTDMHNIGDDADDEVLITSNFDESTWQASNNKLSGPVHTRYDQQPNPVPYQPLTQSAPGLGGLSDVESGGWGTDRDKLFPYLPMEPVKPQSGPVQPQSPVYQKPAPQSPSFSTWQSEPASSGYAGYVPHLFNEEVFQYPSENTDSSQGPAYQKPAPQSLSSGTWQSKPVSSDYGYAGYVPHLENPSGNTDSFPVYEGGPSQANYFARPPPPPPPHSSYIIQSRNGYLHARYLLTHSKYTPEFPAAMPSMVNAVTRPAPSNAAAPKGVKNPQRANW
nr:uncharacterized protein LOC109985850 [Labrus bergylta]